MMFHIVIVFGVMGAITCLFMVLELNWSINNLMNTYNRLWGPSKILIIFMIPLCFMPIILDVVITIGVIAFLGAEGMMGLLVSSIICPGIAAYLYYMRRKHKWKYI